MGCRAVTRNDSRLPALYRIAASIEESEELDQIAGYAAAIVSHVLPEARFRAAFAGRWLGHALHPMLTDFPLGTWMSASLLDIVGGERSRTASRRLLTFGVLAALPTIATGWNDWLLATPRERRVGIVHAAVNTTAAGLYGASLVARRRDHHTMGVALGLTGGVTATVGGFFGGHLSLARDTGRRSTDAALRPRSSQAGSGQPAMERRDVRWGRW